MKRHHTGAASEMECKVRLLEGPDCYSIVGYEERRRLVHKAVWYKEIEGVQLDCSSICGSVDCRISHRIGRASVVEYRVSSEE